MMDEKQVLATFSLLKNIEPRKEWVVLTKGAILGVESDSRERIFAGVGQIGQLISFYMRKPALATVAFVLLLMLGLAGGVIRENIQKNQLARTSQTENAFVQLQVAQNRLDEVKKAAARNDSAKLSSAIAEFKTVSAKASSEFAKLVENDPKKALQASRQIVQLQKEQSQLEQTLGAAFEVQGTTNLENATKTLIENEISDLDSRTLTDAQLVLLNDAKNAYVKGDYETALEKILAITN